MSSERRKFIEQNKIKTNYTTIFLLPMLEYDRKFFELKEFISAYLIDELHPKLALIFDNTDSEDLKEISFCLQANDNFVSIDLDDNNKEVIIVLKIPKEYHIDFNMFKIGRYSKFSNNYKEILLDCHGRMIGAGKCIMMSDALFPNHLAKQYRATQMGISISELPNGQVMSIPNLTRETYRKINEFIKEELNYIEEKETIK